MGDPELDVPFNNVVENDEIYEGGKWERISRARLQKQKMQG